jgi:hypothetical protein
MSTRRSAVLSARVNCFESVPPTIALLQEQVGRIFGQPYDEMCPPQRTYQDLTFPLGMVFDSIKKNWPRSMKPLLCVSVDEPDDEFMLDCNIYIVMWPVSDFSKHRSCLNFILR